MAIRSSLESWVIEALVAAGEPPDSPRLSARTSETVHTLQRLGVEAIALADARYPEGWRELSDHPPAMFLRGAPPLPPGRSIAIVGSRAATPSGAAFAHRLAADLGRLGLCVVSGLARGIDAAAHRGALEAGGPTVAVLPSGLDCVTPVHHRALAEAIVRQGGLVSERVTGPPRFRGEFVRRNRLIAALAGATVVVEATPESGALSTVAVARQLDREVLAVPGEVGRATSRGPHALIRAGARLCENAADVVQALERWRGRGQRSADAAPAGAGILDAVPDQPASIDVIAARAGLPVAQALAELLALQWAGLVEARPGQRWVRART